MRGLRTPSLSPPVRLSKPPAARPPAKLAVLGALLALLAGCATTGSSLALPKAGGPIPVSLKREPTAAEQAFWEQIAPARVLYIPETHNNNNDHEYQFDVMKGLKARGVDFVIGWEMFDETQQPLLDQWSGRQINTETLLEKTDWQRHWGVQSVLYEKMLRWSLGEGVASVALNAPQSLSHKMATGAEFTPEERAMLPGGFQPLHGGYEHFAEQMNQNPHGGVAGGGNLSNFYKAQLVWEQTMASRLLEFLSTHPATKVVVLLGRGHVDGGFGVPAYVRQKSGVEQLVLYPGRPPAERQPSAGTIARRSARLGKGLFLAAATNRPVDPTAFLPDDATVRTH